MFFQTFLHELKKNCDWRIICLPFCCSIAIALMTGKFFFSYESKTKSLLKNEALEPAALWILGAGILLSLFRLAQRKTFFFLWCALLCANFLIREIHVKGSAAGVYIGFVVLLLIAFFLRNRMKPLFPNRKSCSLLAAAMTCYFISVLLDQGALRFIPQESSFGVLTEESIEVVGHLFLLATPLIVGLKQSDDQGQEIVNEQ